MTTPTVQQQAAGLVQNNIIELVSLDLTPFGGSIYRVYNSIDNPNAATTISFLGYDWSALPFKTSGWLRDATGKTPKPIITLSDYDGILLSQILDYQDFTGAIVTRYETTYDNLSTGSYRGPEIWRVDQKLMSDGFQLQFQLSTLMDQRNKKIPFWVITQNEFPAIGLNTF